MLHRLSLIVILLAILLPSTAMATNDNESPSSWFLELKGGPFVPNVDDEFSGASPFKSIFGDKHSIMFKMQMDFLFYKGFGSLGIGADLGFYRIVGNALADDGTKSADETALILLPIGVKLSYRFDYLAKEYNIPLVPYVKGGLNYVLWWITEGDGSIASWGEGQTGGNASGATYGFEFSVGLAILLDFFDPQSARSLDQETGINNSYIFGEYVWSFNDNFGGGNALMVGGNYWLVGLGIQF
ncbi:hypothetical protein KKF84_02105 [Myxococcota bacterium]|nr:hypothetical protein [Myxococcota bacterium]